jgi:hypothetical protein
LLYCRVDSKFARNKKKLKEEVTDYWFNPEEIKTEIEKLN